MDNLGSDYSKTEIAEGSDLSRGTLFSVWPRLEALELVVLTREVGRAKMYKLNKKNPIASKLIELDDIISDFYASKLINSDIETAKIVSEIPELNGDRVNSIDECCKVDEKAKINVNRISETPLTS